LKLKKVFFWRESKNKNYFGRKAISDDRCYLQKKSFRRIADAKKEDEIELTFLKEFL